MYITRWQADQAAGKKYLSLRAGLDDVLWRWRATFAYADWQGEFDWMGLSPSFVAQDFTFCLRAGLYFSVAVWACIALLFSPRINAKQRRE